MVTLGIILARAGSKGLPGKCVRELLGRKLIEYTFDHAKASNRLTSIVFTTDCEEAKELAVRAGIEVIDRPAELASDTATVDAAARHAVEEWESRHLQKTPLNPPLARGEGRGVDAVVLLYGNIPVRAEGLIDRAIEHLIKSGADSVRSVAPVTKQHPDWVHRLDGDRMVQFRPNSIYRRQNLEPLYYHDGAVAVVTRDALFGALRTPDDKQSFLGRDRRAIVCEPEDAVDVDAAIDLAVAEAMLRRRVNYQLPSTNYQVPSTEYQVPSAKYQVPRAVRLTVSNCAIGPGCPTFIMAEAGVNHDGNVETALHMVDEAARAGADAVKFQMFRAQELASAYAPTAAYQREHCGAKSQREMLARLELSLLDFEQIAARCGQAGIALIITPFGVADVARIQDHCSRGSGTPVAAIKIASTDLINAPLLDAAVSTQMPLIVSTGASTLAEIRNSVDRIMRAGAGERLVLLHCISAYPTPIEMMNLSAIGALQREFGVPVGLSDHTTSVQMGGWAVAAGARVLEKHFTLDKRAVGPDHAMSLTPAELSDYICAARDAERALGEGEVGLSPIEEDVRRAAGRSVVAARTIAAGTRITSDMLTLKRPGTGISPDQLAGIAGREATVEIPSDTLVAWNMLR